MDINVAKKLDEFFQKYKIRKYKKNQLLVTPGKKPPGVFYLKEGIVRQCAISSTGEETTLNIFKPNSFFPMAWVLSNTLNPYYLESGSQVTAWLAPKSDFLNFIKNNPDILLDLVKRIYAGLDGYFLRMESLMQGSAKTKLVTELLIYAKRFGKNIKEAGNIKITEKDLAAGAGITRETVSRELQKLKKKGILSFNKGFLTIENISKLEKEL